MQIVSKTQDAAAVPDTANAQSLTFKLHDETFALPAALVREIIDIVPGSVVPGAPPIAGSVINFRGRIIPIVDLRVAFGMPLTPATIDSRYVVVELTLRGEAVPCGLYTDKVNEVTTFLPKVAENPPVVGMRWPQNYVRGLIRDNGGIVVVPDIDAILAPLLPSHGFSAACPVNKP